MQTNLSVNKVQPAFGISVSDNFVKAAHNYFNGVEYRPWRAEVFDKKVAQMFNEFGYDEFKISYKKEDINGKRVHSLYAGNGEYKVPLTHKDKFGKVIEKFQRMNKGELYIKIKQFRQEHPELLPIKKEMKDVIAD